MAINKKDRRYILRNYPDKSINDLAGELRVSAGEVRECLAAAGVDLSASTSGSVLGFARVHPLGIAILVALVSVVYLNSMRNGFHYDDIHSLLQNLAVRIEPKANPDSLKLFAEYFYKPEHFSSRPQVAMPRPLLMVTFGLNYLWSKYEPWSWILVNLMIHTINTLIVYAGLSHLAGRPRIALLTAVLFAVHPINTETANYINCRSESLTVMFMLLTMYFFARSLREDRLGMRTACFVSFALGLLTKELAFTIPASLVLIDYLFIWPENKDEIPLGRRIVGWYLPVVLIWLAYLGYREILLGHTVVERAVRPFWDNLLIQARVLVSYYRLLFLPFHLNISYENQLLVDLVKQFKDNPLYGGWIFPSLVFHTFFITLGVIWRRKHAVISFCILNFYIVLSITSLVPLNAIMNEHRMYLPSVSASLLIAGLLAWTANHLNERFGRQGGSWPIPVQAATFAIIGIFIALTVQRNFTWRTDFTVWTDAIQKSPTKAQVVSDLGNAYYRGGRKVTKRGEFAQDGKIDKAEKIEIAEIFKVHVPVGPIDKDTAERLEDLYIVGLDRARDLYLWAVRVEYNYYKAWHNLGTISYTYGSVALDKGDIEGGRQNLLYATEYFRRAVFYTENGESYNDWASSLMRLAQIEPDKAKQEQYYKDADKYYAKAVELNPELYKSLINRYMIRKTLGRPEEGVPMLLQAIQIYPLDTQPYKILGKEYVQEGLFKKAYDIFVRCNKVSQGTDPQCKMGMDEALKMMNTKPPSGGPEQP